MNRFLRRSANKKAFTMVELLIVIAIIGVLAAMILPNMFKSDVPVKAKGYAKDYFFVAQEFFSRQKLAVDTNNPPFAPGVNDFYFYTSFDTLGNITESGSLPSGSPTVMNSVADVQGSGASDAYKKLVADYGEYMEQFLTTGERQGHLYCVVDENFRVQVCYWSDADITELRAGDPTLTFTDDYVIGGNWCASFPQELSEASGATTKEMFVYF